MDDVSRARLEQVPTTAAKTVGAFLTLVVTYAGVVVADLSDAASWVNQAVVVLGGAATTAVTYWTKNKPKY